MTVRSLALIATAISSVPALAHPGDHGALTAPENIAHITSSAFHLLPLAAALSLIAVMFWKGREKMPSKRRKDR